MIRTIALVDPHDGGHHLTYIQLISVSLLSLGYRVMIFSPKPESVNTWIASNAPQKTEYFHTFRLNDISLNLNTFPVLKDTIKVAWRWNLVKTAIDQACSEISRAPDLVFFTWLDSYLDRFLPKYFLNKFPYRWCGLYFHPWHLRNVPPLSGFRQLLPKPEQLLNTKKCQAIGILDEGIFKKLKDSLPAKTIHVFPDFTDDAVPDVENNLIRTICAESNGRKIVSFIGKLSKRKGLHQFIEIAKRCDDKNIFFLFAGQLPENKLSDNELFEIKQFQSSMPKNCFFYFNEIESEAVFNALIEISDLLFAVYDNFPSSSNILTKAALFRKPVIVSNRYCMGERVKKYNLGVCVEEGNSLACLAEIKKILFEETQCDFGFSEYYEKNSINKLKESLQKTISI